MMWRLGDQEWRIAAERVGKDAVRASRRAPGWLAPVDAAALLVIGDLQRTSRIRGDVLEIGVYKGKSAILLGGVIDPSEALHVCDTFGMEVDDELNRSENQESYADLALEDFTRRYNEIHTRPPIVHVCPSSALFDKIDAGFRLVHIDGSHLFHHVRDDLRLAREISPDGVVVCDDYRKKGVPGVAAAVWESVVQGGLRPAVLTGSKFYGAWTAEGVSLVQDGLASSGMEMRLVEGVPATSPVALAREHTPLTERPRHLLNRLLRR
jgi:hypothetical protein